jgi:type VI secretion system secreted protein Hcp
MAVEIFLKLDGIDGESTKTGHENEIEVFSVSGAANNTSSVGYGTGSGAGRVDLAPLSFSKQADKASPLLFLKCCDGTHIATGKVTFREAGGTAPVEFLIYDLGECFVTSWSQAGSDGGGKPTESLALTYKKINITYFPQNADGTKGDKVPAGWDIGTNAAAAGS